MTDIGELFADGGALARKLSDYRPRDGQIEMARRVQQTLAEGGHCVLEAGTGIGKTFAYLTPIITSGKTALISTGARALQDQLSQRDIPFLAGALGRNVSFAVLKGRANYLCLQALAEGGSENALFDDGDDDSDDWQKILLHAAESEDGDIRGIDGVAANAPAISRAVSTRESCKTQACPHYEDCFLYKARARAREADIVIVNHHLFLSDMRLRDEGVAELLPSRDVVLFDEAHLLPQLAPQFFGDSVSSAQLLRLLADLERLQNANENNPALTALGAPGHALREALGVLLQLSSQLHQDDGRLTAAVALADTDWTKAVIAVLERLTALERRLTDALGAHEKIEEFAARAKTAQKALATWLVDDSDGDGSGDEDKEGSEASGEATGAPDAEAGAKGDAEGEIPVEEEDPLVRWSEYRIDKNLLTLNATPMTGRAIFARQWQQLQTLFFTSATLSVGGEFADYCGAVGLSTATAHSWDSPYDFANRSLLYLPPDLPPPNSPAHTNAVVDAALPLILANGGRAFVLFSSWRALRTAADALEQPLRDAGIGMLKQGQLPNDALLRQFRRSDRVVLLGSQSFWQGVDVRGGALSLLIVDKVPFTPPTDPLLQARDEWRKKKGENSFIRNQLPPAVLLMKQVAGRLIRDHGDYGVFMMGDPRLLQKPYGKTILNALPPMPRTNDGEQAAAFLRGFSENVADDSADAAADNSKAQTQ